MTTDRQAVRDAMQAGYGDASQTVLDDRVAGDVVQALRERGWCSPEEVALIVLAAGGDVLIPPSLLVAGGDGLVLKVCDYAFGKRLRVR